MKIRHRCILFGLKLGIGTSFIGMFAGPILNGIYNEKLQGWAAYGASFGLGFSSLLLSMITFGVYKSYSQEINDLEAVGNHRPESILIENISSESGLTIMPLPYAAPEVPFNLILRTESTPPPSYEDTPQEASNSRLISS